LLSQKISTGKKVTGNAFNQSPFEWNTVDKARFIPYIISGAIFLWAT
jgi:hypothetical protein